MVAVGKWAYWHGLDGVIRGLALSHENIFLDIVGDGPSSANLMNLANSLKLNSHITFHGYKHGHELENLLFSADIGLGTLGIHRKNVKFDSSLKHRLYCAFGLPFIHPSIDPDFNDNFEFNIKAEISDNPLNIGSILDRFEEIQKISGYPQKIRSYALQNLSWHKKITDVLNEL
jgi:hypothetical protein